MRTHMWMCVCVCLRSFGMCESQNNVSVWNLSGRICLVWKSIHPTWANILLINVLRGLHQKYQTACWMHLCMKMTGFAVLFVPVCVFVCLVVFAMCFFFFYPFVCFDIHIALPVWGIDCNLQSIVTETFFFSAAFHAYSIACHQWNND